MQILETLFFMGYMIAVIMEVGFFIVKLTVTPQKVQEKKWTKWRNFLKMTKK